MDKEMDSNAARKVKKADREKLRRDRLNEHFLELANAIDPDRPKNDKATILTDTIQMLKDLTAQVDWLKTEYTSLSEESRELTQEKNELREEKASLKSEIDELNAQYQRVARVVYPWSAVDHSVVMGPPAYPFPMAYPIPAGSIPVHALQPYPFFRNPSSGNVQNNCSVHLPYSHPLNPQIGQTSGNEASQHRQRETNISAASAHPDSRNKPSDCQMKSLEERNDDFSDVATELELKTPGSVAPSHSKASYVQDTSSEARKGKQWSQLNDGSKPTTSSSSQCSSSSSARDNCSNADGSVTEN